MSVFSRLQSTYLLTSDLPNVAPHSLTSARISNRAIYNTHGERRGEEGRECIKMEARLAAALFRRGVCCCFFFFFSRCQGHTSLIIMQKGNSRLARSTSPLLFLCVCFTNGATRLAASFPLFRVIDVGACFFFPQCPNCHTADAYDIFLFSKDEQAVNSSG